MLKLPRHPIHTIHVSGLSPEAIEAYLQGMMAQLAQHNRAPSQPNRTYPPVILLETHHPLDPRLRPWGLPIHLDAAAAPKPPAIDPVEFVQAHDTALQRESDEIWRGIVYCPWIFDAEEGPEELPRPWAKLAGILMTVVRERLGVG